MLGTQLPNRASGKSQASNNPDGGVEPAKTSETTTRTRLPCSRSRVPSLYTSSCYSRSTSAPNRTRSEPIQPVYAANQPPPLPNCSESLKPDDTSKTSLSSVSGRPKTPLNTSADPGTYLRCNAVVPQMKCESVTLVEKTAQMKSYSPSRNSTSARLLTNDLAGLVDGSAIDPADKIVNVIDTPRSRKPSLVPVPAHLEEPLPPRTRNSPRKLSVASKHSVPRSHPVSPTHAPVQNPFEKAEVAWRLDKAIEGLENLVQEAVLTAEDAADRGQLKEVTELIEDATNTIRDAASIPERHLMATGSPFKLCSLLDSDSSVSSVTSLSSSGFYSPPAHRRRYHRHSHHRDDPKVKLNHYEGHLDTQRFKRDTLEPVQQKKPRGSVAIDWAYRGAPQLLHEESSLSSESSDFSVSRRRTGYRTHSAEPLVPQLAKHPNKSFDAPSPRQTPLDSSHSRSQRKPVHLESPVSGFRVHNRDTHQHKNRHRHGSPSSDSLSDDEEYHRLKERSFPSRKKHRDELQIREQIHRHAFGIARHHRRSPIARNWSTRKKRITAVLACFNTALLGMIVGIYAGEVPRIQYVLADENHHIILGNVVLYIGLALSTSLFWPLPLLHGRKPYLLCSLALTLPLQFPQALVISSPRSPDKSRYEVGLLLSRAASGFVLGFANINFVTVLLDLFGASLQSKNPHQEFVVPTDVRRHGGGMGLWLGIWSWCSIGSLAVGFQIGAGIIETRTPDWGFYVVMFLLAGALILNIMAPETRRSQHRKSITEVFDGEENFITRRVARGEIKLHLQPEGPKYWFEEVWAGIKLSIMMIAQPGFAVLALYLAWIYAQIVLVIVLLGSLLSRDYKWHARYVGLGVLSIALGALLATPLTKANLFSRDRKTGFRTDSMTFQRQVTWSSHLVRRCIFTLTLPFMGLAYTLSSASRQRPWILPIVFAGAIGFLSVLAIAECVGLIMETFDTCDLQPGVNTRHRLQSLDVQDRRRRTNYSSFPRVSAGIFVSQGLGFVLAGIMTLVGGIMTRRIGALASTGATAAVLFFLTVLLTAVLVRWKEVQVIPDGAFGTRRESRAWQEGFQGNKGRKEDWRAVVIGNPSGKMRRMNGLELGKMSRWTEIRKLNFLIKVEEGGERWGGRRIHSTL